MTPVLRGCGYEPGRRTVAPAVEGALGLAKMTVVSFADLYAGKIVATLDRQHPRDQFAVRELLVNEGIGEDLRRAFHGLTSLRPAWRAMNSRRLVGDAADQPQGGDAGGAVARAAIYR